LAALCRQAIPDCHIRIIKNDELTIDQLRPHLKCFSAVVVGPGPGSPDNPADIGVVRDLWHLNGEDIVPIFGVCLGLQSLAIEFGGELKRLHTVKHGLVSRVHHTDGDIFEGVGQVHAVRYHSLHVTLLPGGDIEELGWADDEENGRVVMAAKHSSKPFWAVQYHPESVCTNGGGWEVLNNFWSLASRWSQLQNRQVASNITIDLGVAWPHLPNHPQSPASSEAPSNAVLSALLHLPQLTSSKVAEHFGAADESNNFVLLDSAAKPGRYSIIGALLPDSPHITYYVGDSYLTVRRGKHITKENLESSDAWKWLVHFISTRRVRKHHADIPFWGGFIGFFGYEIGYPTLHIPFNHRTRKHPDVNLTFVDRSVVIDNQTGDIYIQSLLPTDQAWIDRTAHELTILSRSLTPRRSSSVLSLSPLSTVSLPTKDGYIAKIKAAKEHLYAGDSYELCLTAQTRISIPVNPSKVSPNTSTSWERYQTLRKSNPAPYSAYIRLHPSTLMSSSPERFLSFSRPPNPVYQLRPIKGTVRKGPGINRAAAEKLLVGNPKEVAENLMIVDLIRHDLYGALGENVEVKKFCGVEEYETVWQLVSVIEGTQGNDSSTDDDFELGWNVLKSSLPPGAL